jgi:haloalkane dehalogenase
MTRVLLSSVFKPFTVPSPYNAPGNMIEHGLFHRSFTGWQGMFTIQEQQHTYPLHLIAHNLDAQTTVLDYPSLDAFTRELDRGYDYVGIGCVVPTLNKARRMCEVVREHSPGTQTVVGGAGAMAIGDLVEPFSDHVCRGDGVTFMRELLGAPDGRIRFPVMSIFHGPNRMLGLPYEGHNFPVAVGLGCRNLCEFCSTSHQFEGRYVPMFDSGRELFEYMQEVEHHEAAAGRRHSHLSFLVYDENFLTQRRFANEFRLHNREQLLRGPPYQLFVFSDAKVISSYPLEELLEMGIDTIWIGVESPSLERYAKARGVDVPELFQTLSDAGIKVFASMIAGLEDHTEDLIREDIDYALSLPTIGVQYMPVNPIPGTTYYRRLAAKGMLLERDLSWFSMSHYNVRHPTLTEEKVLALIREFYEREHEENGPLVLRFLAGRWRGYQRYRNSPNPYVRARTGLYAKDLLRGIPVILAGEVYAPSEGTREQFRTLRRELQQHFGRWALLSGLLDRRYTGTDGGRFLVATLPGVRNLVRGLLKVNATRSDPRVDGVVEMLRDWGGTQHRAQRGQLPWGQPETVRTEYGRDAA